jgi:uncharacterized membrane protein
MKTSATWRVSVWHYGAGAVLGTLTQGFHFASFRVHAPPQRLRAVAGGPIPGLFSGSPYRERFRGEPGGGEGCALIEKTNAGPSTPLKSASLRMTELGILLGMTELVILLGMTAWKISLRMAAYLGGWDYCGG